MDIEYTFVMIKPEAVSRKLIGRIISRYEDAGFTIHRMGIQTVSEEWARELYKEHEGEEFEHLVSQIANKRVVLLGLTRERAIEKAIALSGAADPMKAAPGTIRGDFGVVGNDNIVHASDSPNSAAREASLMRSTIRGNL
jgi:nucleoside-diphosphate kinase